MNNIPLEKSKFNEEFLKLNNDVFKVKYKKGGNRKCIIWLPGRNDYFYHYHISEKLEDYDIYVLIYRNCHELKSDISDYFFDIKDVMEEIDELYNYFKINNYDNIVLYGHSTGGLIATIYQNDTENRVDKIVLNAPFYKYKLQGIEYYYFYYFLYYIIPLIPEFDLNKNTFKENKYVAMISEKFNVDCLYKKNYNVPVVSSWFRNITKYQYLISCDKIKLNSPSLILYSDHSADYKGSNKGDEVLDVELNLKQANFLGDKVKIKIIKDACHDVFVSYYEEALNESIDNLMDFLKS